MIRHNVPIEAGMCGGPIFSPWTGKIVGFIGSGEGDYAEYGHRLPVRLRNELMRSFMSRSIKERIKDG